MSNSPAYDARSEECPTCSAQLTWSRGTIVCDECTVECDECGKRVAREDARGTETVECDRCHDAREAEAFAALGGIEHRVWQAAQAKPCGCHQTDCPRCSTDSWQVAS
jgi:hypothetical protein